MQGRRCWNCTNDKEKIRSPRTGIVYCVSCGIAMNGPGAAVSPDRLYAERERERGDRDRDDDAR